MVLNVGTGNFIIDDEGKAIYASDPAAQAWFWKRTSFLPLKKLERGESLPAGFYEVSRTSRGQHSKKYHLSPSSHNTRDGVVHSYHHTSPHPDCKCSNYGGYVWIRNYDRPYTDLQFYRELLPFEIIEMKFALYGWCKMSDYPFFNRDYLSGEREFVRK